MFYPQKNVILFLKKDIILTNKELFLVENINLIINNINCLIKGINGAGKTLLLELLQNKLSILLIPINYIIYLFNIFYYNTNIPYQYLKLKNKFFNTLSYGNKQLFLFKINYMVINKILVLDEILNGLDKNNYLKLLAYLIKNLTINKKMLLISHKNILKFKNTLLYI